MTQTIFQVDAFTDKPFAGNPAAVCILDESRDQGWMQLVAREMNLSETAFLTLEDGAYGLRWFTPSTEVDLCGHATLAAAHVLWQQGRLAHGAVAEFRTRSGRLSARRDGDWIELDFPSLPAEPCPPPPGLVAALGLETPPQLVGRSRFDLLVVLPDEAAVRRVEPDFRALRAIDARGVTVTAPAAEQGTDFVSRFFAPAAGVDEDPVTGSAHCCLAPFWADRLGRDQLAARQVSERGGELRVTRDGDRVRIAGRAVTVMTAELTLA